MDKGGRGVPGPHTGRRFLRKISWTYGIKNQEVSTAAVSSCVTIIKQYYVYMYE